MECTVPLLCNYNIHIISSASIVTCVLEVIVLVISNVSAVSSPSSVNVFIKKKNRTFLLSCFYKLNTLFMYSSFSFLSTFHPHLPNACVIQ